MLIMKLASRMDDILQRYPEIVKTASGYFTCKKSPYATALPERLSPELLRFIGIIHGDGNMSFSRIHVSDRDLRYHRKVLHPLFYSLFRNKLNLFHDKKRNTYYSHIKNKVAYTFLTEVLEIPKGSVRKGLKIPGYFHALSKSLKREYLGGLFDSEGHVRKNQVEVDFLTTSKEIFNFVTENLEGIKFSTKIRSRHKNKEYEIYITGRDNVKKFCKTIMIKHPAKVERLRTYLFAY